MSTTRDKLIYATIELMLRNGYHAVSVDNICSRAGVKKGSFYHFFVSKEVLTLQAMDYRHQESIKVCDSIFSSALSPVERLSIALLSSYDSYAHFTPYSEFKKRIKKGRDPLPRLSSCTTGPNGETVDGHYQLGYERFEPCDEGYVLRERSQGYRAIEGACYRQYCAPSQFQNNSNCQNYTAILRPKPYYVKMWVNGAYLGQYFYQ